VWRLRRACTPLAEEITVITAQYEERVQVVGGKFLDALPSPDQIFERFRVAFRVIVVQIMARSADSKRISYLHNEVYQLSLLDNIAKHYHPIIK
jgi:hypothetical protein